MRASARLWEPSNRRTRRNGIVVVRCPVLLPAAYLYSCHIKKPTFANEIVALKNVNTENPRKNLNDLAEMERNHFRTPSRRLINLESMISTLPLVTIIFARPLWNKIFTRARLSWSRFFISTINWPIFCPVELFFGTHRPSMVDGPRKMVGRTCQNIVDSSAHCQAIFRRLQHPRGGPIEGGVLSGSTFRSPVRDRDGW